MKPESLDHGLGLPTAAADQTETIKANVQSLADMLEVVRGIETMRAVPFGKETVIQLVLAALLPVAPLVLTMMPLKDLLKHLVKVVF